MFARRVKPDASSDIWADEYAHKASVIYSQSRRSVTIGNIRQSDFSPSMTTYRWVTKDYDLSTLRSIDLVMSYWAGENIAHVFISFGFENDEYLAISIETRRKKGQKFSSIKGFFNYYDLIYVVAEEQDLIGVRTDIRKERVYVFRLNIPAETCQRVFIDYLQRVAELHDADEYYNSLLNNCTTNILRHARKVAPHFKYHWRILLSGHADRYCYDMGLLETKYSAAETKSAARIRRDVDAPVDAHFSKTIRVKSVVAENLPDKQ